MSHTKTFRVAVISLLVFGLPVAWPAPVDAQRRAVAAHRAAPRPVVRPVVVRGVVYSLHPVFPGYWQNGLWVRYGSPWRGAYSPYAYGYGQGYGYGVRGDLTATVRLQVTPREAEVFIDGYSAGVVDDFDGVFQRLRLRPGGHEIVVYLDGFRTFRQNLYLNPGSSRTIRHTLEPLADGEPMENPPTPSEDPGPARSSPSFEPRPAPSSGAGRAEPRARFGTLVVRVQPADAEIVVDGERWSLPADETRVAIQLTEGRHTVEIRKAGFSPYREDVLIRHNAALTLNVSLTGN